MKKHPAFRILAVIILSCSALTCLSALSYRDLTTEQSEALTVLETKFGKVESIGFQTRNSSILQRIAFKSIKGEVNDISSARSKADSLLRDLEPYLKTSMVSIDSVHSSERTINKNLSVYNFIFYQNKFSDFNYEGNTPTLSVSLQSNQYVVIYNGLVYDFTLPELPYITAAKAGEIADSVYWEDISEFKNRNGDIPVTEHQTIRQLGDAYVFTRYKDKSELSRNQRSSILNVCSVNGKDGVKFYRLAYKVLYSDGYEVKVDAKNGNVLFHMNTRIF